MDECCFIIESRFKWYARGVETNWEQRYTRQAARCVAFCSWRSSRMMYKYIRVYIYISVSWENTRDTCTYRYAARNIFLYQQTRTANRCRSISCTAKISQQSRRRLKYLTRQKQGTKCYLTMCDVDCTANSGAVTGLCTGSRWRSCEKETTSFLGSLWYVDWRRWHR